MARALKKKSKPPSPSQLLGSAQFTNFQGLFGRGLVFLGIFCNMSVIGSLIFCTDCGNLLRESTGDANAILHCTVCGTRNKDTVPQTIVSESKPSTFPSALRAKRSAVQTLSAEDRKTEAITEHTCARCGRTEMFYTTVQLRSADEGSTVFYRCVCGYKETSNN